MVVRKDLLRTVGPLSIKGPLLVFHLEQARTGGKVQEGTGQKPLPLFDVAAGGRAPVFWGNQLARNLKTGHHQEHYWRFG